ncbi:MAG: alpha/beta hydrolase [Tepidiformaceae bacterium]
MTTALPVIDKNVSITGLNLHYRDWPNEGAPTLVLLHGFTGHAASWDTFGAAMNDRYRVIALDQRGHGDSEWASDYAPERRVEDLEQFVATLGLGRFTLLGLSMGGICAYGYAAKHPETLEKLVIVDIAPTLERTGMSRISTGVQAKDVFDTQDEAVAQARLGNPLAPDDALRYRAVHNLKQRDDGKWTFKYDVALRDGSAVRGAPGDAEAIWASLANITCPTLLVRGAESDLLGMAAAERMVATIPNCKLVQVAKSGHSVPLDNPAGFLEAVRSWL